MCGGRAVEECFWHRAARDRLEAGAGVLSKGVRWPPITLIFVVRDCCSAPGRWLLVAACDPVSLALPSLAPCVVHTSALCV